MPSPSDQQSIPPQWFDSDPSDNELATFIDSFQYSVNSLHVRIVDTPRTIRGEPARFPIWGVVLCGSPVLGICIWLDLHGKLPFGPFEPLKYPIILLAFVLPIAFLAWGNHLIDSVPPFFIFDKVTCALELPRYGVIIAKPAIRRFVEVRGWKEKSMETAWGSGLTVLVVADDGRTARYVLGNMQGYTIGRSMFQAIADSCGAPLIVIYQRKRAARRAK